MICSISASSFVGQVNENSFLTILTCSKSSTSFSRLTHSFDLIFEWIHGIKDFINAIGQSSFFIRKRRSITFPTCILSKSTL